ncbi:MAG: D-alanyl-D-alanine carboxypeptidase, partial [Leeuwenhoekiella sp.]
HSLSGFIKTKSGKTLIFSFMNSNYVVPTSTLKKGMEQILLTIRDSY